MRDSSSGPMSDTVARTGWPCSPKTSHSVVGQRLARARAGRVRPGCCFTLAGSAPVWLMPVRSPFTSAMNTGTPMRLKLSASVCSVMVLPVPVAPVMRPWRLARAGSRWHSVSPRRATRMGSGIGSTAHASPAANSAGQRRRCRAAHVPGLRAQTAPTTKATPNCAWASGSSTRACVTSNHGRSSHLAATSTPSGSPISPHASGCVSSLRAAASSHPGARRSDAHSSTVYSIR
jgi:hypothetical protein